METLKIISTVIGFVLLVIVFFYGMFAILSWVAVDPLNIVRDTNTTPVEQKYKSAIELCKEDGGLPIISGWSGNLKNCQFRTN